MLIRLLFISFLLASFVVLAQNKELKVVEGTISFISSQNVYVKFNSTEGIETGDTLFLKENNNFLPAVRVDHKSSTSLAGISITSKKLEVNYILYAFVVSEEAEAETNDLEVTVPVVIPIVVTDEVVTKTSLEPIPTLSGRFSIQSYSNFTNNQSSYDYQRWRYTFQLNANRIGSSGFSYSQYISFAYRADDWNRISSDLSQAIRVYDLAVKYDFNPRTLLWLGRHINNKISNIGSIDGLQFETGVDRMVVRRGSWAQDLILRIWD
jgi:hypothetical protein